MTQRPLMSTPKTTHTLFLFFNLLLVTAAIAATFKPQGNNILLNCGANSTLKLEDGRTFQPDTNPGLSPHHVVYSSTNPPDLYSTARVFTQPTHYNFSIQQKGRHFLRLHLYPIHNSVYGLKSATFSVTANGFTLLRHFSCSKLGLGQNVVLKEYVLELGLDSKPLVVTLAPHSGSIAFLNAIEVIPLPDRLFPATASSVPKAQPVGISNAVAFETLRRINMGGPLLDSKNDALWRVWRPDRQFLINSAYCPRCVDRP